MERGAALRNSLLFFSKVEEVSCYDLDKTDVTKVDLTRKGFSHPYSVYLGTHHRTVTRLAEQ